MEQAELLENEEIKIHVWQVAGHFTELLKEIHDLQHQAELAGMTAEESRLFIDNIVEDMRKYLLTRPEVAEEEITVQ